MSLNNLLAPLYEWFFNWNNYQTLLTCLWDNYDYGKFAWLLLLTPPLFLVLFYKIWEPMNKQRLMWLVTIIIIAIINYTATTGILYNNECILDELGSGGEGVEFFIFQISMICLLYTSPSPRDQRGSRMPSSA